MIRMVDLHRQYIRLKPEIDRAIARVLETTAFIKGPEVETFANELSLYLDGAQVVPCGNGTDAIQIALMALDLQPGDEVMVPAFSYAAAAEVVLLLRLKPVFVDVDPRSFNIDMHDAARRVTKRTRAIIPVHLFGQCADLDAVLRFAAKHNLHVVEDGAQSLGADYRLENGTTRKAGTIGTIGTTSFFPSKNLGCFGDGGAVFTRDQPLAKKLGTIANHGQGEKYVHTMVGINSRLDTIQAAVLNVKLKYIDDFTKRRNDAANWYDQHLSGIKGILLPERSGRSTHVFHQYTLIAEQRDALKDYLKAHSIPSMIYYPIALHLQEAYRMTGLGEGSFPVSESLCRNVISLPIHTEMEPGEIDHICDVIRKFYHG